MISDAAKLRFAIEVAKYPADQKQSAVMACLAIIQQETGFVSTAAEASLAVTLGELKVKQDKLNNKQF